MRVSILIAIILFFGCTKKEPEIPKRTWPQIDVNVIFPFVNSDEQIVGSVSIFQEGYEDVSIEVYTKSKKGTFGNDNIPEFFRQRGNFIIQNPEITDDSLYVKLFDERGRTKVFQYYLKPLPSSSIKDVWMAMAKKYELQSSIYNLRTATSFTALDQTFGFSQTIIDGLPGEYRFEYSGDDLIRILVNGASWIKDSSAHPYPASIEDFYDHVISYIGEPSELTHEFLSIYTNDYNIECRSKSCAIKKIQ